MSTVNCHSKYITVVYAVVDLNPVVPSVVDGSMAWVSYERDMFTVRLDANIFGRGYRPLRAVVIIDNATGLEISPFSISRSSLSSIFNEVHMSLRDTSEN